MTVQVASAFQYSDSGAEVRFPRIVKALDQRMFLECCLNDSALHALATAVDQPHLPKPCPVCFIHVFLDHRRYVSRRESMEIEGVFDRQSHFSIPVYLLLGYLRPNLELPACSGVCRGARVLRTSLSRPY